MEKKPMRAWYSARAVAAGCGTSFYARADGTEVEVTTVNSYYLWEDKQDMGEVVRFVRPGIAAKPLFRGSSSYHRGD